MKSKNNIQPINRNGGKENGIRRTRNRNSANTGQRQLGKGLKPEVCEIEVTTACNLRCIHCYASAGQASTHELSNKEIIELLSKNPSINHVIITGGEPFMRMGIMDLLELLTYHLGCSFRLL